MIVHGVNLSPFVRKVLVALKLKGLEFEQQMVMPGTKTPEYLAISPLGKVPAFEDGDVTLSDSSVICEYLEDAYPEPPIFPKSAADKARARWLEEFADSKLTECIGGIFFERVGKAILHQQPADEERVATLINDVQPPLLDYLEGQLPDEGYLFGDFTVADIAVVSCFINAGYGQHQPDAERWPKVTAFIERVKQHPVVAECLEVEAQMIQQILGK